jgi:hypothetical protein
MWLKCSGVFLSYNSEMLTCLVAKAFEVCEQDISAIHMQYIQVETQYIQVEINFIGFS